MRQVPTRERGVTEYLQHQEVRPWEWRRIWFEYACLSMGKDTFGKWMIEEAFRQGWKKWGGPR